MTTGGTPGDILVGTCSWTDPALVSSGWYPTGARGAEGRLRHYASRFPVVEADSTFYALPSERVSALWAERTPEGFVFDVKAFALLTGHGARVGALPADLRPPGLDPGAWLRKSQLSADAVTELWQRFTAGVAPLRGAGRLGTVLFQFSPWFRPGARAREYIEECQERAGTPIAVEFRHPGWLTPDRVAETAGFLRERQIPLVAVDTLQGLPASVPPVAEVTAPGLAVVRFHGRNPQWGTGSKEDRFRHHYTRDELKGWVPRVRALAERSEQVHVLFNNCCAQASVQAAGTMSQLLAGRPDGHDDADRVREALPDS
ncbi:hypothetical protein AR457_31645 [Streptomyces agglomeratus]|uniref:DUF72 domain-containing protein n=1 Tax=Streptomyces agglomeratus TaxID=285458 RepID=UPI00085283BA|nr:DUF72 domain-containing protein [Streptomyces agglomeratus]OEJ37591.1 hypothetical protein BGK70_05000 [Streptomyces agglomeratus]OEJ48023.1 hypothetical protein AR457_31645 [Streptomyces agglomeratus]OEJ50130.1 hypothetical protein BGK72_04515 [Streptomyces agglomeratus]OEJ57458.1 hypothetical protein BGM19_05195 [Streptomyces agglomeratus]